MKNRTKLTIAGSTFAAGVGLILWNMRDPNRGYYEQPKEEQVVTIQQIPAPVRTVIERESAGGVVEEIQKETKAGKVQYEADIIKAGHKIGLEIGEDGSILERKAKKIRPPKPS
jgi:hypothetical protein